MEEERGMDPLDDRQEGAEHPRSGHQFRFASAITEILQLWSGAGLLCREDRTRTARDISVGKQHKERGKPLLGVVQAAHPHSSFSFEVLEDVPSSI